MSLINIDKLTVQSGARILLHHVSLQVKEKMIVGVYGPNGSGKSTLLKALSGNLSHPLKATHSSKDFKKILYLGSQMHAAFSLSVAEWISIGNQPVSLDFLTQLFRKIGMHAFSSNFLRQDILSLSSGEKQIVQFVRVILRKVPLYFLDESFSQLDVDWIQKVSLYLKETTLAGHSFVLASHDLNFLISTCDRLLFLKEGKMIASGPTEEVIQEKNLRALYPTAQFKIFNSDAAVKKVLF